MSEKSRVLWSEGSFLLPQFFQQHDRYLESMVNGRCVGLRSYNWGFYKLQIDGDLLKIGKLAVTECEGVFQDGTPFHLPENDALPLALDVPTDAREELVYLALPVRRREGAEADSDTYPDKMARFRLNEIEVKDSNSGSETKIPLQVAELKTQLMMQREKRSGHSCLGLARIVEVRSDKSLVLDDEYISPSLNCLETPKLNGFLNELHGLLHARGEEVAGRVAKPGFGGVAEFADWLVLQLVNRNQPLVRHLALLNGLHPDDFYRFAVQMAGELATYTRPEKRPASFPAYDHDDLQNTFFPVMDELRTLFGKIFEPTAIQLPLFRSKYGVYGAKRPELTLLKFADFYLAARAKIPAATLQTDFPPKVKIGPGEEIGQLVNLQLPGIEIQAIASVPPQIPYHAGYTYFELSKDSDLWKKLEESGGFGIHIGDNFPELEMELWAVKRG